MVGVSFRHAAIRMRIKADTDLRIQDSNGDTCLHSIILSSYYITTRESCSTIQSVLFLINPFDFPITNALEKTIIHAACENNFNQL